ncbi:DUF433 domain-containing protein [Acidobacteria bacterium AH-259-D05]|nr:DUF433 domain-containing protein [Acidobacteria bacterium AH-259-D05]
MIDPVLITRKINLIAADLKALVPNVCIRKPCIRGLRFPVSRLLGLLAPGETKETIFEEGHDAFHVLELGLERSSDTTILERALEC